MENKTVLPDFCLISVNLLFPDPKPFNLQLGSTFAFQLKPNFFKKTTTLYTKIHFAHLNHSGEEKGNFGASWSRRSSLAADSIVLVANIPGCDTSASSLRRHEARRTCALQGEATSQPSSPGTPLAAAAVAHEPLSAALSSRQPSHSSALISPAELIKVKNDFHMPPLHICP